MTLYMLVEFGSGQVAAEAFDAPHDTEALARARDVAEGPFELWRESVCVARDAPSEPLRATG